VYLDYVSFFWVVIAILIAGIFLGRAWYYLSSQDENLRKSRLVRGSSNYLLGMNYLISNQPDLAIMELSRAAKKDPDAIEVSIVLGNLYREKGQVERALHVHKAVLERQNISPSERNLTKFCLGLDYKTAGIVDRSIEVFEDLLEVDRNDERIFRILIQLYEESGQLDRAYRLQQELIRLQRSEDYTVLALLEVQIGKQFMEQGNYDRAEKRFKRALDLEPKTYPANIHYGDLKLAKGDLKGAVELWERMARSNHKRSHLVYNRLNRAYAELDKPHKMVELLKEIMEDSPNDWRSRVFYAGVKQENGDHESALASLKDALQINPGNLAIHLNIWKLLQKTRLTPEEIEDYMNLAEEKLVYLDQFVCIECGYRSTEYLYKCPHCHSWESLVEVRV
jgi:lipopolysaccharide biosynthesis regulator YciM